MYAPTLRDVYQARKTIAGLIPRTPLQHSAGLSQLLDAEVYLKRDDHLPLGAFKSRGGINIVASLSDEERRRGLITASTGNHGQSIASACRLFGGRALIVLPEQANPLKVESMRALAPNCCSTGETLTRPGRSPRIWPSGRDTATCIPPTSRC